MARETIQPTERKRFDQLKPGTVIKLPNDSLVLKVESFTHSMPKNGVVVELVNGRLSVIEDDANVEVVNESNSRPQALVPESCATP